MNVVARLQSRLQLALPCFAASVLATLAPGAWRHRQGERFIQPAWRKWAYGSIGQTSGPRTHTLRAWTHFYNWHRRHHGIACLPPMSRMVSTADNLLTLHS